MVDDQLYPKKRQVLEKVITHLEQEQAGFIKVPTGWGKTYLAKHIMKRFRDSGRRVVFAVYQNTALLQQMFRKGPDNICPATLLISGEERKPSPAELEALMNQEGGIVLGVSVDTLIHPKNRAIREVVAKNCDLLVVDEIHNFINNKGNEFIREAYEQGSQIFGMTATPMQGILGRMKFVWQIIPSMSEIWSKSLSECILDMEVSGMDYYILRSHQDIFNVFDEEDFMKVLRGVGRLTVDCSTVERVNSLVSRTNRAKMAYGCFVKGEKALVFCAPTKTSIVGKEGRRVKAFHSKLTAALFNGEIDGPIESSFKFSNFEKGHIKRAAFLSSDLGIKEQREIIEHFRNPTSNPQVLCTIGKLVEGFDFPELKNLFLLRPTLSPRLFVQQLGRVLRNSGKKAKVFEIVDDISSVQKLTGEDPFDDQRWESLMSLQPEYRIEAVVAENGDIRAIQKEMVSLYDLVISRESEVSAIEGVQLLPVQMRTQRIQRILASARRIMQGPQTIYKHQAALLKVIAGISIFSLADAEEIRMIVDKIDEAVEETKEQIQKGPLSTNASGPKMEMFVELRWFALCRALSSLSSRVSVLSDCEKRMALEVLGFSEDTAAIPTLKQKCLTKGLGIESLDDLKRKAVRLTKNARRWLALVKYGWVTKGSKVMKKVSQRTCNEVLWFECFEEDDEVSELVNGIRRNLRGILVGCGSEWR